MDIWTLLIVFLIGHGLFNLVLFVAQLLQGKFKHTRFMAIITLLLLWYLLEFLSVRQTFKVPINLFYGTRYGSWLLLGPCAYFFFLEITRKNWVFKAKHLWHFVPFIIFVLILPWASGASLSNRQIHYGMLSVFDYRPKTVTWFEWLYSTVFYLQFVHLTIYLFWNLRTTQSYVKALKQVHSSVKNTQWMYAFNGIMIVIMLSVTVFLYLLFESDQYRRYMDYIYVLPMGLFIYAIGYKLFTRNWQAVIEKEAYESSTLTASDKNDLADRLLIFMNDQKPYLNNNLRIASLAQELEVKQHHLSQVINENYNKSFFDFINEFRVAEAKEAIKANPNFTLLQIAYEAGFNNKTSFVNAFKKFTHTTPSAFRKSVLSQ